MNCLLDTILLIVLRLEKWNSSEMFLELVI